MKPMPALKQTIFRAALAILLAGCTGCALRQSGSTYLLSKTDSEYFLLSPDAAASQRGRQTLRIPLRQESEKPREAPAVDCSITGPWFSLARSSGHTSYWIITMPAAPAWEASSGAVDMKEEWQSFERALDGLQQRQCFASMRDYLYVKRRIAESLSAPLADTLFYRYSYGPGGYVDMEPGMQLRIERDFFAPNHPTDYQGTAITYYGVGTAESGTTLKFLRVERKSPGSTVPALNSLDEELATQFASAARLRLFLQDLVISGNAKTPPILIGGSPNQDLDAVTRAIESDPNISCQPLLRHGVTCAMFNGVVTVSPMLQVYINGRRTYVPIGSKLSSILPHGSALQQATLIRTLRIDRSFQGKPVPMGFPPDLEAISQLLLFGGDKVSWSKVLGAGK